jgi:hypothetical protein
MWRQPQGFMPLQDAFGFNKSAFLFDDLRKTCTLSSRKLNFVYTTKWAAWGCFIAGVNELYAILKGLLSLRIENFAVSL